jgi:hypothetical protein
MKTARLERDRTGGKLGKLLAMRGQEARENDMRATISKLLLESLRWDDHLPEPRKY